DDHGQVTPKKVTSRWLLSSTINPPTAVPSSAGFTRLTSQAANGATMMPPIARPATTGRLWMNSSRSPTTNPSDADAATRNSDALTDPITVRGAVLPRDSSVLVVIGPQPPPPDASMKPPNNPSGLRNLAECGVEPRRSTGGVRNENRDDTWAPIATRIAAISGAAFSVDSDDSTVAPRKAPTAPGPPSLTTIGQSMFLNFQCDRPAASVVPSSARWTAALACAAPRPLSTSNVVAVTPKAIPRAPSTSWA